MRRCSGSDGSFRNKGEIELVPETAGTAHVKLTARNRMFAREVENRFGDLIARLTGAERVTVEARQADATKASAR